MIYRIYYKKNRLSGWLKASLTGLFALLSMFPAKAQNYWTPDINDFDNYMTVVGYVVFNGEELQNDRIEIGCFIDDKCRGIYRLQPVKYLGHPYACFLAVWGSPSDNGKAITIKMYNHETGQAYEDETKLEYLYNGDLGFYVPLEFNFIENRMIWNGKANDNNWNTPENWNNNKVPGVDDIVEIPGDAPVFPVLDTPIAPVDEIHFGPGAQIEGQSNLRYNKIFVSYDLSKRGRWNMLSIPLGQVYPADFGFGGYPVTWMRTFSSTIQGNITNGNWVSIRNNNREAFSFGDGFVLWLDNDDPAVTDKGIQLLNNKREIPFFYHHASDSPDSVFYSAVHLAHDYDNARGTSTFYNFTNVSGEEHKRIDDDPAQRYSVVRNDDAYRLLDKDLSKQPDFADGTVAITGNPYMATLDFLALATENKNIIDSVYHIWTGKGYTTYSFEGLAGVIEDDMDGLIIAPLQAFLVEKAESAPSNPSLLFKGSMAKVNKEVVLRSSADNGNKLDIVAGNPVARVRTFIAKRESGQDEFGNQDARKIINGISDVPEIYTLKPQSVIAGLTRNPQQHIATAVNIINNDEGLIPLGLATSYAGNITLSFSGMDTYNAKLSLIDAVTKKETDLTGLASGEYVFNYTPKKIDGQAVVCEDRFFIRISKTATGLNEAITEKVKVFETNGFIQVISGVSNPVKEVLVYNLQGALIYKENAINVISHTINRNLPAGVYIVSVISEKNKENVKLIVR